MMYSVLNLMIMYQDNDFDEIVFRNMLKLKELEILVYQLTLIQGKPP